MSAVSVTDVLLRELELERQRRAAAAHPAYLLDFVTCIDAKTGERFEFQLTEPCEKAGPEDPHEGCCWYWQRHQLDAWLGNDLNLVLKARQIGITWLAAGLGLWTALYQPGTRVLIVSINLEEAIKVVNRLWDMFESLPPHLRNGVQVLKPARGHRPSQHIEFKHKDGSVSAIIGLPSTKYAGHGETAALVILDEYARHEYARDTWKAVFSTADLGGKIVVVSTANGVSNEQTGEGNFYHHLWVNAEQYNIVTRFLPWNYHPGRDEAWYEGNAASLPSLDRAEQYPRDPEDAFINTGECWFDLEKLAWYTKEADREPLYRFEFEPVQRAGRTFAKKATKSRGDIRVYEEPKVGRSYAIGADVATGRGMDYSAAYVIDLETQAFVAEYHSKIDPDLYAEQLHFLGRWYNDARLAVEMGGGYGEPVVLSLRDGKQGRPTYPKLYRHTVQDRPDQPVQKNYGFPMNGKTRSQVINQLEAAIRERTLPYLHKELVSECRTFCKAKTNPSPRAQDGCNDDRVMAACITLEMFRLYGMKRQRRRAKRERLPEYPWLAA